MRTELSANYLKEARVGVETAGIQDGILPLVELGDFLLQPLVEVLRVLRRSDIFSANQRSYFKASAPTSITLR